MSSSRPLALLESRITSTEPLPKSVAADVRYLEVTFALDADNAPSVIARLSSLSELRYLTFFADLSGSNPLWAQKPPLLEGVTRLSFNSEEALSHGHLAILLQLFPSVKWLDLYFNVEENSQCFISGTDPSHCNIGPLESNTELVFTWHDYDHLKIRERNVVAVLDIRYMASLEAQCFNIRHKIWKEGWQLRDLHLRSTLTADLGEAGRMLFRTQIRALLRCNNTCPHRLQLEFPLYSADTTDDSHWIDPIFTDLNGSIKILSLGVLVMRGPPDEVNGVDRERWAARARRVCNTLLRIFVNNRAFWRMQALVLDKRLTVLEEGPEQMEAFISDQLRFWLQRRRVHIYSEEF